MVLFLCLRQALDCHVAALLAMTGAVSFRAKRGYLGSRGVRPASHSASMTSSDKAVV